MATIGDSFLNRPRPVELPRFACATCQDGGLVATGAQTQRYADLFTTNLPCVCEAGDQWRPEFEVRQNPPKCACGRKAAYCLFSARPVCKGCFGDVVVEYREEMAARASKRTVPQVWNGWGK